MNKQKTLQDYLNEKQITINEFSAITGVSLVHLYRFVSNPDYNIHVDIARKIWKGTLAKYGEGLSIYDYLRLT